MNDAFKRVAEKKIELGITWEELARKARIGMSSWMCGVPYAKPKDEELKRIAPVLGVTFEYLKNGEGQ
ncbi:MAG: helix-turn-helix transcriptional regulator [Treponema sp.]|nr:helix-turn-helix transcriptional regulator [Treponema sp.]